MVKLFPEPFCTWCGSDEHDSASCPEVKENMEDMWQQHEADEYRRVERIEKERGVTFWRPK